MKDFLLKDYTCFPVVCTICIGIFGYLPYVPENFSLVSGVDFSCNSNYFWCSRRLIVYVGMDFLVKGKCIMSTISGNMVFILGWAEVWIMSILMQMNSLVKTKGVFFCLRLGLDKILFWSISSFKMKLTGVEIFYLCCVCISSEFVRLGVKMR